MELGCLHPDYLFKELTARQLHEWQAFYEIDPFGDQRDDLRTGILCSVMNNRWRAKNETPVKPMDFMPYIQHVEQTPEDIQRTLKSILGQVING